MDLALPQGNEAVLLARAKALGSELFFLYEARTKKDLPAGGGVLIRAEKPSDIRRADKFSQGTFIVVSATDPEVIRLACSAKRISAVTHLAAAGGRDHTHYRRGNVNQVTAKLASENKTGYIADFSRILELDGRARAVLLGRIMQNIRILKKYKIPCRVASFARDEYGLRNPKDLEALGRVLGI